MGKLALLVYVIAAPTIAGALMVAALVAGLPTKTMIVATLIGFVLAIPIALTVGKKIA